MGDRSPKMTPALFHILLSLAEGSKHGYALLRGIAERTNGRVALGPSSLYYSLGRLEDAGLISETGRNSEGAEPHEEQRRYYGLTSTGREYLSRELGVLGEIVDHAKSIGFQLG